MKRFKKIKMKRIDKQEIFPQKFKYGKVDHDLIKKYLSFDMHFHSNASDGTASPKKILEKIKKTGIGVSVSDHNEIKSSLSLKKSAPKNSIIHGIEVSCIERVHTLFYFDKTSEFKEFYNKEIHPFRQKNTNLELSRHLDEILDNAKKYNAVISAAHPFLKTNQGVMTAFSRNKVSEKTIKKYPAFEVINSLSSERAIFGALAATFNMNKSFTAGSDGHTLRMFGKAITFSSAETITEFLEDIRKKRNFVMGKSYLGRESISTAASVMRKSYLKYPIHSLNHRFSRKKKHIIENKDIENKY